MNSKNSDYLNIKKKYFKFLKKKRNYGKPIIDKIGKLNKFYLPLSEWIYSIIKKIIKQKLLDYQEGKELEKVLLHKF